MPTSYPSSIDSYTTKTTSDLNSPSDINELQEAIVAIETELGTDPAGQATDVKTRLANSLILNVKDYGATGDGVTDDTTAIQNTINALPARGGVVYFPMGSYLISSTLSLPSGDKPVFLIGDGRGSSAGKGTEIKLANNSNVNMIEYTSTVRTYFGGIFNMSIDGNADNQTTGSILSVTGVWTDFTLQGVYFRGARDSEVFLKPSASGPLANVWIDKCLFENYTYTNVKHGLELDGTDRGGGSFWITNSYFYGMVNGIHFDGKTNRSSYFQIDNCYFLLMQQHGIYLKAVTQAIISNCRLRNNGTGTSNTYDSIFIDNDASVASDYISIMNNQFVPVSTATERYGVNISGSNIDYVHIENNLFNGQLTGAINIASGANANGMIRNNIGHITENSGTATVASGTTSIAVNHGLSVTPSAGDITVTPTNSMGSATKFYIDTYTSTQFTIHTDVDPGVTTATFAWKAEVL
jgi:hypothetical protein